MNKGNLTFSDLVTNYGQESALYIVQSIERMADLRNELPHLDGEARLQAALDNLNESYFVTKH